MNTWTTALLRTLLITLILLGVLAQVVVYFIAKEVAAEAPELAHLRLPYSLAFKGIILCGQIVLAAIWPLLGRVRKGAIFTRASSRWVDVTVSAGGGATGIAALLAAHFLLMVRQGPPTVPLGFIGLLAAAATFTLLMVTMRSLLRLATEMRTELAEVI